MARGGFISGRRGDSTSTGRHGKKIPHAMKDKCPPEGRCSGKPVGRGSSGKQGNGS